MQITDELIKKCRKEMNTKGYFHYLATDWTINLVSRPVPLSPAARIHFQFSALQTFINRIKRLIKMALHTEAFRFSSFDFRIDDSEFRQRSIDDYHTDVLYLRVIYSLEGSGTEYITHDKNVVKLATGDILIFSGDERTEIRNIPATKHKRTCTGHHRALIVISCVGIHKKKTHKRKHKKEIL